MSDVPNGVINQPQIVRDLRNTSRGGRGAIAGQGIFHPEHWKAQKIPFWQTYPSAISGPLAPVLAVVAPVATVTAAGANPLGAEIASAPAATVPVSAFAGFIPSGAFEKFRNRWFRPVVETLASKWEGWWRL